MAILEDYTQEDVSSYIYQELHPILAKVARTTKHVFDHENIIKLLKYLMKMRI